MPPRTVKIGVIVAATAGLETAVPLYEQIIKPDINAYARATIDESEKNE